MAWPPTLVPSPAFDFGCLSARAREVAWYFHHAFPLEGGLEFLDVNKSMSRLSAQAADGTWKNPWQQDRVSGLTGHTKFVVRYRDETVAGGVRMRPLLAAEYFALQGWCADSFAPSLRSFAHPLLPASLAGNAFSAFQVGPILLAALGCAGSFERRILCDSRATSALSPPAVRVEVIDSDLDSQSD